MYLLLRFFWTVLARLLITRLIRRINLEEILWYRMRGWNQDRILVGNLCIGLDMAEIHYEIFNLLFLRSIMSSMIAAGIDPSKYPRELGFYYSISIINHISYLRNLSNLRINPSELLTCLSSLLLFNDMYLQLWSIIMASAWRCELGDGMYGFLLCLIY